MSKPYAKAGVDSGFRGFHRAPGTGGSEPAPDLVPRRRRRCMPASGRLIQRPRTASEGRCVRWNRYGVPGFRLLSAYSSATCCAAAAASTRRHTSSRRFASPLRGETRGQALLRIEHECDQRSPRSGGHSVATGVSPWNQEWIFSSMPKPPQGANLPLRQATSADETARMSPPAGACGSCCACSPRADACRGGRFARGYKMSPPAGAPTMFYTEQVPVPIFLGEKRGASP